MADTEETPSLDSGTYAQHLAEVNKTQAVRAVGDVYSVHGVLVCRRGSAIDYETARKIVRHKLTMPLDQNVQLDNTLSARGLYRRFATLSTRYSDLATANKTYRFAERFESIATHRDLPPIVAQKLTVMNHQKPSLMDRTLMGAWFACLMGVRLGYEDKDLALLFLAAVSRDLGMLHIDPRMLEAPSGQLLSADQWKAIQSHVVASHMILMECEGIPSRVLAAVMEHHENVDGTGYPSSRVSEEMGDWGQILGLADTVSSLRLRRFAGSGRNLRDTLPVVQVDADACRREIAWAAMETLLGCGVKRSSFHGYASVEELRGTLQRRSRAMMSCNGMLEDMPNLMPVENKKAHTPIVITAYVERLALTLLRSGLSDGELAKWLALVADDKEEGTIAELAEIDLQQKEMVWQFRRLHQMLVWFAEKKKLRSQSPVRLMIDRMDQFFTMLEKDARPQPSAEDAPPDEGDEDDDPLLAESA